MTTKEEILAAIARLGSVAAAAKELGLSRQAISKRFRRLSSEEPLRKRYEVLTKLSRRGPAPEWEDQLARDRAKHKAHWKRKKQTKE